MKSVCLYFGNRGIAFLRDLIKLDDWENTLKSLKSAEDLVKEDYRTYNMAHHLNTLLQTADFQRGIFQNIASLIEQQTKSQQQRQIEEREERNDNRNNQYLIDLRATDPHLDKKRIAKTKGGLLPEVSNWILGHQSFRNWLDNDDSKLLWIKGDPGKGKTMLMIAIINELETTLATARNSDQEKSPRLIYFFCQGTNSALNSATAVLRGLICRFVKEYPPLISYLEKAYVDSGSKLLDHNAFFALSHVLSQMLSDERIPQTYIVIDALDECEADPLSLLDFIIEKSARQVGIKSKWIISSRPIERIERKLAPIVSERGFMALALGENQEQLTDAVNAFIDVKISKLDLEEEEMKAHIREKLRGKADGTFLWVALVFEELQNSQVWEIEDVLEEIPSSLEAIYSRILDQILPADEECTNSRTKANREFCKLILSRAILAYRPLYLDEIAVLSELPQNKKRYIKDIVRSCGSLLAIQDDQVYLVHQSVRDFLSAEASKERIFPHGLPKTHLSIALESLKAMKSTLKRNIYEIQSPGAENSEFKAYGSDPLASVRYSCVHWISHFCQGHRKAEIKLGDEGSRRASLPMSLDGVHAVEDFFENCFLYWVEALGILRQMGKAILFMQELEQILRVSYLPDA